MSNDASCLVLGSATVDAAGEAFFEDKVHFLGWDFSVFLLKQEADC